jgi:hypothetical protein
MAKRLAPSTLATRVRSFASASAVVRRPVGDTGASASSRRLALSAKARSNSARRASAASPGGTAEPVIGQLVERYHAKRVWARDAWHLWSRWQRKLLSHTLAVYLCQQQGLGSLRFADLLAT